VPFLSCFKDKEISSATKPRFGWTLTVTDVHVLHPKPSYLVGVNWDGYLMASAAVLLISTDTETI
jgi:hypothetical protein